jgi:rsbT co-antagonist protein RsbR
MDQQTGSTAEARLPTDLASSDGAVVVLDLDGLLDPAVLRVIEDVLASGNEIVNLPIARPDGQIRELTTPVLEVDDRVLIVPLIGTLDPERLRDLTERLLAEITRLRARMVILDVTGVPIIDSSVSHDLLNVAAVARLMGAQVVMSGISTAHAGTMTRLDVGGVETVATLADAVALARTPRHIVSAS